MSQLSQSLNLRKQFRIANCNFSLQACRWKFINFRQKMRNDDIYLMKRHSQVVIPNVRIHETSVILADHIYMFGGIVRGMQRQNFSAINLKNNKWHQLNLPSNPPPRDSHGLAIHQQQIYIFGGSNQKTYFNDLYSFNTFTNQWKNIENKSQLFPLPRDPMVFLSIKNQYLLLIGGINLKEGDYFEDAFIWKDDKWRSLQVKYPTNLILAKAVQINGKVFVFGGINRQTKEYNSILYEVVISQGLSKLTFVQLKLNIQINPSGRVNHQLLKVNNQYFILIGGQQINKKINKDIWVFDLFTLRWSRIQPKNGVLRGIHSFSAAMYNNIIYLIGGFLQNKSEINDQVITIEFANQEIFKSQICQNCISLIEKKQVEAKKFPKDLSLSVGFLFNMALQIKFPFHAISMIYESSKYFKATYLRIISEKTINNFNFLRIQFDGCTFSKTQFISFISHTPFSSQLKKFTQNIKLGALRLGKTFLLVSSDKKFRYVYLLSAQSRVSPHFDQAYVYYSYIENIQLQRIQTQQGVKQRQLILNIIKTHLPKPEILLSTPQKSILLIFQNRVVMSAQRDYICQFLGDQYDIKIWKNQKKINFLQQRGYDIQGDIEISLRKWMSLYYFNPSPVQTKFYFNQNQQPVLFVRYKKILDFYLQKAYITKVQLPTETGLQLTGEIYITSYPNFIENNYGLLIYINGNLYSRYEIDFGKLFPQHFYKSKYKQARTIFYQLGYINIVKGLQENYFKNGFTRQQKYMILLQKIQEKCDQKRRQILQNQIEQDVQQIKTVKKVKIG